MRLRVNRHFAAQIVNVYMPHMIQFADARTQLHPSLSDEFLNMRIVSEILKLLHKKLQIKIIVSSGDFVFFRLTDAETICMYKFLLHHPIMADKNFELQQRDALVHVLHKFLIEPVPAKKIFTLYR